VKPTGIVDRGILVRPTGLEQQDAACAAVDQASRDDGAGRPGADEDDVGAATAHVDERLDVSQMTAIVDASLGITPMP
jgi:hypothetical protein